MSGPFKIVAPRHFENPLVIRGSTEIGLIPHVPNPRVPVCIPLANVARRIGGSVILNDQLKIFVILDQDGLNRLMNEPLTVVNRHADANQRSCRTGLRLL